MTIRILAGARIGADCFRSLVGIGSRWHDLSRAAFIKLTTLSAVRGENVLSGVEKGH